MERGLNVELGAKGMRVQLQQWVNISTQFKGMATVGSNGLINISTQFKGMATVGRLCMCRDCMYHSGASSRSGILFCHCSLYAHLG